MNGFYKLIFILTFFMLISIFGYARDKDILVLSIPPWGGAEEEVAGNFKGLITYLEETLHYKVEFKVSSDYDTLGDEINSGKVDIAILSSSAYVKAKNKFAKIKYLCTPIDKKLGKPSYSSYIFVKKGSGINTFKDLKNKRFAFVDESSSSGYKFPLALMLSKWKINPQSYFKKVLFLGSHPNIMDAVSTEQADGGAASNNTLDNLNDAERDQFIILEKIENIPYDGVIVSPFLKDTVVLKIKKALLEINKKTKTTDNQLVEEKLPWSGFVEKNESFYNIVRETEKTIETYLQK